MLALTPEAIEAAVAALEARGGPFAVHDAVARVLPDSGWDPAGDGDPARHDRGIAEIIRANVDAERDVAAYLREVEAQLRGAAAGSVATYRPIARRILTRVLAEAARADAADRGPAPDPR
jgi:hypothetical protein